MAKRSEQRAATYRNGAAPGFTVMEMMIALVVLALLFAVALPSYQDHMRKSRRAAAQSHLMDIAQRQQQYLLDARSYAPDLATLGITTPSNVLAFYGAPSISAPPVDPPTFTVTITPKTGTSQVPDGQLRIDYLGGKFPADKW